MQWNSSAVDRQLFDNVKILHHVLELFEANLAVAVLIGLDNSSIDELLQLDVVQVVANHHLEHIEELTVRDEAVAVDVVNLESEPQLLLMRRARGQRVQALHEFEEADAAVVVSIEHVDDALHERIVRQLGNVEELLGFEGAGLVFVELVEVLIQLLELLLREIQIAKIFLILGELVTHIV